MLPKTHIILGLIASIIIFLIFPGIGPFGFIIIWSSSVLIDVDHYLFYVWLKKDLSLRNAYKWFIKKSRQIKQLSKSERKNLGNIPCFLHGIEALIILAILSYFASPLFLYVLMGFLIHEFLDMIHLIREGYSLRHVGSQTLNLINFRRRRTEMAKLL